MFNKVLFDFVLLHTSKVLFTIWTQFHKAAEAQKRTEHNKVMLNRWTPAKMPYLTDNL